MNAEAITTLTRDELYARVAAILQDTFGIDPSRVRPEAKLGEDLDIDSIDAVDLIVQLKPLLGGNLKPEAFRSVRSVQDVVEALHGMMHAAAESPPGDLSVRAATALLWLATLLYPLAIYFGTGRFEPRWLALLLLGLALLRAALGRDGMWLAAAGGALLLVAASMLSNNGLPLKLYPALVNAVLLAIFVASLRHPPSAIERLARLREPELPPEAIAYTRKVTQVWCGFFVLNGGLALYTALLASDAVWALYNGLIAYALMGALFLGEWLVRPRRVAHN